MHSQDALNSIPEDMEDLQPTRLHDHHVAVSSEPQGCPQKLLLPLYQGSCKVPPFFPTGWSEQRPSQQIQLHQIPPEVTTQGLQR